MDKRNRRIELTDKKTDFKVKDRGDLKRICDKILKKSEGNTQVNIRVAFPERGDSGERKISTNQKQEKIRFNYIVKKPTNEESKMKYLIHGITEKEISNKKSYDKDEMAKKSHLELRKRIRDRYTIKFNVPVNKSDHLTLYTGKKEDGSKVAVLKTDANKLGPPLRRPSDPVERPKKQLSEETTQTKEKLNRSSSTSNRTDLYNLDIKPDFITENKPDFIPDKKPEKVPVKLDKAMTKLGWKVERNSAKKRKPVIKTIMSKTGSARIFKAVTFIDQRNSTPLEIKIPGSIIKKQQKVSKFTETTPLKLKPKMTVSKASVKQEKMDPVRKKTERKRDRKFRHVPSPECSIKESICPPTEVARWAPASIDAQTKPYYEAWVNTTLAAISKNSKKDRLLYAKQAELLRCLQKALEERPVSPELFYENFADEKYAGRIKIRQTDRVRKK